MIPGRQLQVITAVSDIEPSPAFDDPANGLVVCHDKACIQIKTTSVLPRPGATPG
jgi:hypothetical protein